VNTQLLFQVLRNLRSFTVTYVVLQVLTGIETVGAAVALVVAGGWDLPAALALTIPMGMPLLIVQGSGVLFWRYGRNLLPESADPVMA
jgi:hypothetical protein